MIDAAATSVTLGLVQHRCVEDPEANMRRAIEGVRDAAARGAQIVCLQELFRSQYFCQTEDHRHFALAEPIPGPSTNALAPLARELGVVIIASLFEKRAEGLYHNTAVIIDADGSYPRQVPEDAHPGRSALLREVLLHAGRSRVPELGHPLRSDRRARLLGSVVSRGGAADRPERRADPVLSHGHRLAACGEEGARRAAAGRLGNDAAEPRDRQRRLRLRGQPGGTRGSGRRRHRVLGRKLRCRSRWAR